LPSSFNQYTGRTDIYDGGIAGIGTMNNGGVAGPLGASSSAAANLKISDGTRVERRVRAGTGGGGRCCTRWRDVADARVAAGATRRGRMNSGPAGEA
jgi:hypothetical protein